MVGNSEIHGQQPAAPVVPGVRPSGFRVWFGARQRLLWGCLVLLAVVLGCRVALRYTPRGGLQSWLATQGLQLVGAPVVLEAEGGAVLLAREGEAELPDVYWMVARFLPDGRIAAPGGLYNLTHTVGAAEGRLTHAGDRSVVYAVEVGERIASLERLDFAGEPVSGADAGERLRKRVTNWQQVGRAQGIARQHYRFAQPVRHLRLRATDGALTVDAGLSGAAEIRLEDGALSRGGELLQEERVVSSVGEWVPWLVDRARAIPWIGPEPIAWLEHHVFGVRDTLKRAYQKVHTTDHAAEVAAALPQQDGATEAQTALLSIPDPESGWPPAPISPLLVPAVDGEGAWRPVVDDPYVRDWPGAPPLFYQAFLRGDVERPYNKVYLTLWDPRQLQLHIVSGTEEPVSATGETGAGTIPKDPETLKHLVGAFNGGFQALHGEFGMMADSQVYLPPKPWAATVAVFRDGSVGMGSWPGPSSRGAMYEEARAVAEIPADMLSMRQNLTSLVEDRQVNPWKRWWWGAAPAESTDQTLTQRSALCLRDDGFMLYAWGDFLSPEALGEVLAASECARAMHLDMNAGHTGFEFYNVTAPGESLAPADKRTFWQHEGQLPGHPGYTVRARRAVTSMQMPLPRYIRRDPRDFFYLTVKPTLPGPAPAGGPPEAEVPAQLDFRTDNLPQAGYPPALARHMSEGLRVLRIDTRRVEVADRTRRVELADRTRRVEVADRGVVDGDAQPSVELLELGLAAAREGDLELLVDRVDGPFVAAVGEAPTGTPRLARGRSLERAPDARAWVGIDAHGFLVYAESDAAEVPDWQALCGRLGVSRAIALAPRDRLALRAADRWWTPDGRRELRRVPGGETVALSGRRQPATRVLFGEVEPRPYRFWAFLQDQRVRYFRAEEPSARAPVGTLAPGAVGQTTASPAADL